MLSFGLEVCSVANSPPYGMDAQLPKRLLNVDALPEIRQTNGPQAP
jgi:hypothetical protein